MAPERQSNYTDDQSTKFFLLGLSPNASRISVRLWVEADAAELRTGWASICATLRLLDQQGRQIAHAATHRLRRPDARTGTKGKLKFNTESHLAATRRRLGALRADRRGLSAVLAGHHDSPHTQRRRSRLCARGRHQGLPES